MWCGLPDLPGESARASLKQVKSGQTPGVSDNLPGESARASLKLGQANQFNATLGKISRANRPGPH